MMSLVSIARRKRLDSSTAGRNFRAEAKRKLLRLQASCVRQWDFIRFGEVSPAIGLRLAVTYQNNLASALHVPCSRYTAEAEIRRPELAVR